LASEAFASGVVAEVAVDGTVGVAVLPLAVVCVGAGVFALVAVETGVDVDAAVAMVAPADEPIVAPEVAAVVAWLVASPVDGPLQAARKTNPIINERHSVPARKP
jgi:hypothetical protein